jgi:hypothetical protein
MFHFVIGSDSQGGSDELQEIRYNGESKLHFLIELEERPKPLFALKHV